MNCYSLNEWIVQYVRSMVCNAETEHINQLNGLFENNGALNQFRKIVEHSKMLLYHSMVNAFETLLHLMMPSIDLIIIIIVHSSQGVVTTEAQPDPENLQLEMC